MTHSVDKFFVPKDLSDSLVLLGERERVSVHTLLLAAFKTLLHRYFGQENILVVSSFIEVDGLRVVHSSFAGDPTFKELLHRVHRAFQNTGEYQEHLAKSIPSEKTRGNLINQQSVFQVYFGFNDEYAVENLDAKGFKFAIQLSSTDSGLGGSFSFDPDFYDNSEVSRFVRHLEVLIENIVANPGIRISELSLLTSEERHRILVEWNDTKEDYDHKALLHTLIEEQVSRTPNARAVIFNGTTFNFSQLNRNANQLAHYLLSLDMSIETLIGVFIERSFDMVVGLLGIHKAGGAYVPMDPSYPPDRLAFIAQDSQMPFLLTQSHLVERLPRHKAQIILLDEVTESSEFDLLEENPEIPMKSENLACVIYTSGSTGMPKGVMLSHQNIVSRIQTASLEYPPHRGEVYAQTSSLSFVDHLEEFYLPLVSGFPTHVIPTEVVKSPQKLVASMERSGDTRMLVVPSQLRVLLNNVPDIGSRLSNLTLWHSGGEALPQDLNKDFHQKLPHATLMNAYGTTETTADATSFETSRPSDAAYAPIGSPYKNVQVYILDSRLNPVPIGVPGEIYIGGTSIARGYLNRPDLTAERFIQHPFSQQPDARLFHTGDLGRYLPNGDIEFLGRQDDQVKIRGMRVELGEIEMTLNQHPDIKESVVIARKNNPKDDGKVRGSTRLFGYVVPGKWKKPTASEVREFLKGKLPDYAIPDAIVVIDELPLTSNGKVDKKALPEPHQIQLSEEGDFDPPRDQSELKLALIFEDLLGFAPIGIHDNFFERGGDSLMAVELLAEIERVFGKNLPMSILVQTNTVASIAEVLRDKSATVSWSSLVPIQPGGTKPPFFCIHADGGVLMYRNLSRLLGSDQPFYGLQAQGLDGKRAPFHNVKDMAAHYIQEIQSVQPTGPYYIGAFSLGGIVLFEMAQQLREAGELVGLIAFFDAHGPGYPQLAPGVSKMSYKLSIHLKSLQLLDLRGKLGYLLRRSKTRIGILNSKVRGWVYIKLGIVIPHRVRYNVVREAIYKAADEYVPQPYPGKITIFRATNQPEGVLNSSSLGWGQFSNGSIEIIDVVASHNSIMKEPHLQELAHKLEECLMAVRKTA